MRARDSIENVGAGAHNVGVRFRESFGGAWNSVRAFFKGGGSDVVAMPHEPSKVGLLILKPLRWSYNMVKQPFTYALTYAGHGLNAIGGLYHRYPFIMLAGTAIVGVAGVHRAVKGSAQERSENELQNELLRTQMMQAQAVPAQAQANTITAADMAAMEARMKQGGHSQALAAREATAPASAEL